MRYLGDYFFVFIYFNLYEVIVLMRVDCSNWFNMGCIKNCSKSYQLVFIKIDMFAATGNKNCNLKRNDFHLRCEVYEFNYRWYGRCNLLIFLLLLSIVNDCTVEFGFICFRIKNLRLLFPSLVWTINQAIITSVCE